jgi:hypothetical protein
MGAARRTAVALVAGAAGACVLGAAVPAHAVAPATVRVSVSSTGAQTRTTTRTQPTCISRDGRYVLMTSKSSRLVAGDTNRRDDAFLRDTVSGTTVRVSVSSHGRQGNGASVAEALSPDGRFVLLSSHASNLVRGDTNGRSDVFLRDRRRGLTWRVSLTSAGRQFRGPSTGVAVSADGRFVLFTMDPPWNSAGHGERTYLRDRVRHTTTRLGRRWDRWTVNGEALSADGRYVAWTRRAEKNDLGDTLYIHDRATGGTVDVNALPGWSFGDTAYGVQLSADGSAALVTGQATTGRGDVAVAVWRRDGSVTQVTDGTWWAVGVGISDDGDRVAIFSEDPTLVPGDTNKLRDLFVRDLSAGTTQRVDVTAAGAQIGQGVDFLYDGFGQSLAALSGDGQFAAFASADPSVVPGDTNGAVDVFLRGPLG